MNECLHRNNDNISTIVFPKNKKITGVENPTVRGVCKLCGKIVSMSLKEYKELMKEGDMW